MTTLEKRPFTLPSASLGKANPLPDLAPVSDTHVNIQVDRATISEDESRYMGWGRVNGILPYRILDGYNRDKQDKTWTSCVLENDKLRATFMPELGGRLWSLFDKEAGRELLHANPVFQPCNLALRNAWISGGVEWNLGIIGHTPFTVSPMFTEFLKLADGTPVLRMYQYERVRRIVYRVEACLPEGSDRLFVRVRIDNTRDEETKVYWWSNMAVDEREDVRVLVPATRAYRFGYGSVLTKETVPYQKFDAANLKDGYAREKALANGGAFELDVSHSTEIPQAMDFFFDVDPAQRKWIAALGSDGYGMAQTSTDRLIGRKLFVWGMGAGGRNWQKFLAKEGCAYIEIQSGIAHTQLEHLPMAAGETIDWCEAYGALSADPKTVQGRDWDKATRCVDDALEKRCPHAKVEAMLEAFRAIDGTVGENQYPAPDGWVAAERALPGNGFRDAALAFPKARDRAADQWIRLAKKGALPCPDVMSEPAGYQTAPEWEALVKESIESGLGDHWYAHYQLGVMRAHRGDLEGAKTSFETSLRHDPSPWAYRCLGQVTKQLGDEKAACAYLAKALALKKERSLAIETLRALNAAREYEQTVAIAKTLPPSVKKLGRVRAMQVEALIETGEIAAAERALLSKMEMADVREGEVFLTDLWFRVCAAKLAKKDGKAADDAYLARAKAECPPPAHLDFRMN